MVDENDQRPFLNETFFCVDFELKAAQGFVVAQFAAYESPTDLGMFPITQIKTPGQNYLWTDRIRPKKHF